MWRFGVSFTYVIEGIDSKWISLCLINDYSFIADLHIFDYGSAECTTISLECIKVKLLILNIFFKTTSPIITTWENQKRKKSIPIKMKGFLNVEIFIYSRAGFFIYSSVDFSQRCSNIFFKINKIQLFVQNKWKIPYWIFHLFVRKFFSKVFEDFLQNKQNASNCIK